MPARGACPTLWTVKERGTPMATVKQILDTKGYAVWSIHPQESVFTAIQQMAEKEVGALVVLEGDAIGRLCSRLWASPGVSLVHKSLCSAARMARTKVQRKKQPSAYLQRAAEQHVLDLIDVLVCEALYADADCIATVQSYGIMPVIRIKQEQYNIMKEVDELSGYISFARAEEDYERKLSYRYRIFEHLPLWKMYKDA